MKMKLHYLKEIINKITSIAFQNLQIATIFLINRNFGPKYISIVPIPNLDW